MAWALLYGINAQVGRSESAISQMAPIAAPQSTIAALSSTVSTAPANVSARSVGAIAQQVSSPDNSPSLDAVPDVAAFDQPDADTDPSLAQVTSVSQLTDVRPTDWAFQALQSLVERYGCIVGYPDKTYRGNRALTRYEFAAGLNACLDRVNELIAAGTADLVKKEDLVTLQRLQEQFAAELATSRGRVDALEVRTTTLAKQQFSTTTKLFGTVWINVTGATAGDNVQFEGPPGSEGNALGRFSATRNPLTGQPTRLTAKDPKITESFLIPI